MKIDSIGKQQEILPSQKAGSGPKQETLKFGDLLEGSLSTSNANKTQMDESTAPISAPILVMQPVVESADTVVAYELIRAIEHYQILLADPSVNLKMLEPSVQGMQTAALQAEHVLDNLPNESGLKPILTEAIASIHLEIERFATGMYVDD